MRPQPDLYKQAEDYELQLPYQCAVRAGSTGCSPVCRVPSQAEVTLGTDPWV